MRSEKTGATRDQNAFLKVHFAGPFGERREDCHIEVQVKSTFR
jgi:hypothetical protein